MTLTPTHCLPNEEVFRRLLENSKNIQGTIIHDPTCNTTAGYSKLLYDIVALREELYEVLPRTLFDDKGIIHPEEPYILIQSPGNYEFIVASPAVLPKEARYFLQGCQSSVILVSTPCWERCATVRKHAETHGYNVKVVPISAKRWSLSKTTQPITISIDEQLSIDPSRPSLVLYTSGTTGPPKGVVQLRPYFADGYGITKQELFLAHRPVHWIGGLRSIINLVVSGTRQEIIGPSEVAIWDRLRKGGVTMLCCVVPMWCKLMRHYQVVLAHLEDSELEKYLHGARVCEWLVSGGQHRCPRYYDFGVKRLGCPWRTLEFSLGKPEQGVSVNLSEGDEGEILIKSSFVFARYLGDDNATRNNFTSDGYFRTGDYGRHVDDEYVMEGRVATDFVRFYGYKVPIVEVETCLSELPFVVEACIVSIPDKDAATRVAAVARFQLGFVEGNLQTIRDALSHKLSQYKLPTALRVLGEGEEIPKTIIGKVMRRKVVQQYFTLTEHYGFPADVETYDINQKLDQVKAWDWAGLQGC
ncbi:hypothetical protein BBP40_010035 [Aspergillus hancockii]|nr:hypothetical protein BBP40_010035 [Aspergillus hancockii]